MQLKEIAVLSGGIIFLVIGIWGAKINHWKYVKHYIPIAIGLFLIYISTIGPLSKSGDKIDEIKSLKAAEIKFFAFGPTSHSGCGNRNLFKQRTIVSDRNKINELCRALSKTTVEGEGFLKNPKAVCQVSVYLKDERQISFEVRKSEAETGIVLDSDGWHYANLSANEFGALMPKNHQRK